MSRKSLAIRLYCSTLPLLVASIAASAAPEVAPEGFASDTPGASPCGGTFDANRGPNSALRLSSCQGHRILLLGGVPRQISRAIKVDKSARWTVITQLQSDSPRVVAFRLSGKLHDEDYLVFVPAVQQALTAQGRLRLLAQFEDFAAGICMPPGTTSGSELDITPILSVSPLWATASGRYGWPAW